MVPVVGAVVGEQAAVGVVPVELPVPGELPVLGVVVDVVPVNVAAAVGPVPVLGSPQLVMVKASAAVSSFTS